ncbi:YihY/virulence factor BrkB family protein [Jannaschia rubra]|uniref:YihY family inner membrane protein n=1 Tax=Jannaschia rubra TaxID=282197 RepID=A0A0M6XLT0_9RHOB|nr:YihY/virulence factor BrkB family protein [Jannaschia rubra]CTQ32049.1 ribonuclease BN/unknown domain fusion protein [Jannaschia rubra]SFG38894.1 membrane protein [Jannaschia rubra]
MSDTRRKMTRAEAVQMEPGRGRGASGPTKIPAKGWKDIAFRVKDEVIADHVSLVAAGIAFYALLAIFPAITALMSIAGLIYEPSQIVDAFQKVSGIVPSDVSSILLEQAKSVTGSETGGLTLGLILGLVLALWSSSKGMGSLIEGLNLAYDEKETRGFIWLKLMTIGLTLAMIVGVLIAAVLIVVLPVALAFLDIAPGMELAIRLVSYLPLALLFVGGVAVLYRVGPDRASAQWRWLTPGVLTACALWLVASIGFSIYVRNFGSYNETFGSIAGVIVLLMWMWLSAFVILLGAELNSEIEAQTARDTTTGPREPMGFREATKADTLGPAR